MDININNFYDETYSSSNNSPTLKEGDTGEYVVILQDKLKILGFYFASITGSFDDYTKESVMEFQESNGITPNGIVNNDTWEALYSLTDVNPYGISTISNRPTLRLGDSGNEVSDLQTILKNLLYYNGEVDGNFGIETQNAVKTFQINNNLTPDGIVGRDTWRALTTLYSPLAICDNNNDNDNGESYYTVVSGDTLYSIARRFNTTVDELKALNNLTSNILQIGQKLLIPNSPSNELTYTVVRGDKIFMKNIKVFEFIKDVKLYLSKKIKYGII